MFHFLESWLNWIAGLSVWQQFQIAPAKTHPAEPSIFGFGEFLAALALFLVVVTASEFRYRYRLTVAVPNLRRLGFWVALVIGVLLLGTDVWFDNDLPTIELFSNPNDIKAALALVFLVYVFRVIYVAVLRSPQFTERNAKRFFNYNYWLIHEGNPDRLEVIAQETIGTLKKIVESANHARPRNGHGPDCEPEMCDYAVHFLLLIGHRRFCRVVADKMPAFALECFEQIRKAGPNVQVFQFARNIGQEFIRNTQSAFYQEESGFHSGLLGYGKPTTKAIFGDFNFVENCASAGESPLDTDYAEAFTGEQMHGYVRAGLAFLEDYLRVTKGEAIPHSFALARMMSSLKNAIGNLQSAATAEANGERTSAFQRLAAVVYFIREALELSAKHASHPRVFCISKTVPRDIYDHLAYLIFEIIFKVAPVSSPSWLAWHLQYVSVWAELFSIRDSPARRIVAFKLRRLIYDEIKALERSPNFRGARFLAYALYVFGLMPHRHLERFSPPLQRVVLRWTKRNYRSLVARSPRVAEACLTGSVAYDPDHGRLVKTYDGDQTRSPIEEYLELEDPAPQRAV